MPISLPERPLHKTSLSLYWVLTVPLGLSMLSAVALVACLAYPNGHGAIRLIVLLSLLLLGGAIALGWRLIYLLQVRLRQFSQASRELAEGNLAWRLPTHSPLGELNHLAQSFNQMADRLQHSFQHIQTALDESEAKFTTVFRTSPDPMAIATLAEGRLLEVNHSLVDFFGHSRADLIGRTTRELGLWHDMTERDQYCARLQQQGRIQNQEIKVTTKSGLVKTILLSAEVQRLEGQDCQIVAFRDISALKQVEAQLRKTEDWLEQYSQSSPSNIYTLVQDPDGHLWFEYMSSAVETIHEVSAEQVLGDASLVLDAIHPDDRAGYEAAVLDSQRTLATFFHQWRIITPSGRVKWIQANSRPERRETGAVAWHGVVTDITERVQADAVRYQAEMALQESETRFRQLAEAVEDGFFVYDVEAAHYVYVNRAYWEIRGIAPDPGPDSEAFWLAHIHPDDRDRIIAALARERQGEPFDQEYRYITPGGELRWLRSKAFPLCNEAGQVVRVVGTVENFTDRKQAAAALEASEARFRQLAETVREGFFVYEIQADVYSYTNPAYGAILGIPHQLSYPGNHYWLDRVHPDDRDRIEAGLRRERQGEDFDQEYRYLRPDGELRWLRSKAFPLRDGSGTVVRIVGTVEDCSDRKQAEIALQASEARFRRAFDNAPYGISLVSATGQFVQANAYYCALLGYTEAELMMMSFKDITHPDDWADDWAGFQRMMGGKTATHQIEKRYITKQGEAIPVIISAAPIYDSEGKPLYSVGHVQDIRDRLAIDRMKDEFISVVSHELRTPITSIQGALVLLGAGVYAGRPEKAQRMLDIALTNSDRLVRLVDDILSFERLESGKVQLEKEPCSVAHLMYQAIDSVQPLADQSGITIALTPLTATLWAAPDAILQVLTNLLSNAIKFSSPGGTIWLKADAVERGAASGERRAIGRRRSGEPAAAKPLSPPAQTSQPLLPVSPLRSATPPSPHPRPTILLFTVQDHGRGIPADKLEMIFDQFQQVDASDSRRRGGTGLGLAICKRIVQQHLGRIWAESAVGQGSMFYVALPLAEEDSHG